MNRQKIDELVAHLHQQKEYRPTNVSVLFQENEVSQKYLVVQSAKGSKSWMFPQGGIEQGESLQKGLMRELDEELGIDFESEITKTHFGYHYERLDAEKTRHNKRGFSKGKAYFFTLLQYTGDSNFKLQAEEIRAARWLTYEQALARFETGRQEKALLLMKGLEKAVHILDNGNYQKLHPI